MKRYQELVELIEKYRIEHNFTEVEFKRLCSIKFYDLDLFNKEYNILYEDNNPNSLSYEFVFTLCHYVGASPFVVLQKSLDNYYKMTRKNIYL